MRHILVIGAGRSASSLIKYLLTNSEKERLHITIGDLSEELAIQKHKTIKMLEQLLLIFLMKLKEKKKYKKPIL